MGKGQELYERAKQIIPGGTQLLSKRPEMFLPGFWPSYYEKAQGITVTDLDGKEYKDMSYMGIGANVLGYCDEYVNQKVMECVSKGNMCTLNAPEEVELAEKMIEIHPWAEMVRYSKTGGEAMAISIRIARANTKKDIVLFSGYHGWHDWYLSANLSEDEALDGHLLKGLKPQGVPRGLAGTNLPFHYNSLEEFNALIEKYEGKIAAVVMEPLRSDFPEEDFLKTIRKITEEKGIVLIFDEVTSGFRLNFGGAHLVLGVNPDIAVFGKALGNGYPISMIIGNKKIMHSAEDTFISSTYWTEKLGLVAALATLEKFEKENVAEYLVTMGKYVQENWSKLAEKHGLKVHVGGIYPLGHFSFEVTEPLVYKTYFTQSMLEKGYLAGTGLYLSYAHTKEELDKYFVAVDEVFESISVLEKEGTDIKSKLWGEVCHGGFQRLTK